MPRTYPPLWRDALMLFAFAICGLIGSLNVLIAGPILLTCSCLIGLVIFGLKFHD